MSRSIKLFLLLTILTVVGGSFVIKRVLADPGGRDTGHGYFTDASYYGSGFNRVLANGITATSDKTTFINEIENFALNGNPRERTGGAFIIQTMRGNVSRSRPPSAGEIQDWKDRIYAGEVSLSVEDYSYDWNSGFYRDNGGGSYEYPEDDFFYEEFDTRQSIVFRHNGNIVFALKIDCGNVVGALPGVPPPPPPPTVPPPPPTVPPPSGGPGIILGRVFVDNDGDGSFEPGEGDVLTQNPPGRCGGYSDTPVNVEVPGIGQVDVSRCNPTEPHYQFDNVTPGNYTVQLANLPLGWVATSGPYNITAADFVGPSRAADRWFGMKPSGPPPEGVIAGRVFVDVNGNGVRDSGEDWTQNPPGNCGGYFDLVASINVAGIGVRQVDQCNPGGPHYQFNNVPAGGPYEVALFGLPPGWTATGGPANNGVYSDVMVPAGGAGDRHFGAKPPPPPAPTVTPVCLGGTSAVSINWNNGGPQGADGYVVDISTSSSFSSFSNKFFGVGTTSVGDAPSGFNPGITLNAGTIYYVRIYYPKSGAHSQTPHPSFAAKNCDRPPIVTLTSNCATKKMIVQISDPDGGGPFNGRYEIGTNPSQNFTSNGAGEYQVDMASQNQYNLITVRAYAKGVPPPGSFVGPEVSGSAVYGKGGLRACLDREFTINPTATSSPIGDDEAPDGATFNSGFTITYSSPAASPGPGVKLTVTRKLFIKRGVSEIDLIPPITDSNGGVPFPDTVPKTYVDTKNPLQPPAYQPGDQICVRIRVNPGSGSTDTAGNVVTPPPSGPAAQLEDCFVISNKPYFRVYGGDVLAGAAAFGDSACNYTAGNTILAFDKGPGPNAGAGAGAQLAAQAMGVINGFSTAVGRTANPTPLKGLSFSNTAGIYGGSFNKAPCNPDYFASATSPVSAAVGPYIHPGGTITGKQTVYADDDVLITGNINYAGGLWTSGNVPSFQLVARGNIYILSTVTNLDGVYIAQPNGGAGGTIYTCALAGGTLPDFTNTATFTTCGNKLTITGAFIAKSVKLLRTLNSLRDSTPGERNDASAKAAEIFQFSPEMWLGSPLVTPTSGATAPEYDSVTSLPPIL